MQLSTYQEIELLHRKYAPTPEAFDLVFTHCRIVCDIAVQLIASRPVLGVNEELVRVGCLVHDMGVYRLMDKNGHILSGYIKHGIEGEALLAVEGMSREICRFASHHTGVGLTVADIKHQNLPLPLQDFLADSIEERLVMYADKFHSKSQPPRFNTYEQYRQYIASYGADYIQKFERLAEEFGMPDLAPLIKTYGHSSKH